MMAPSPQPAALDSPDAHDPLTGALNRHGLDVVAAGLNVPGTATGSSRRASSSPSSTYAVIVLDLDHFKKVNDQFGFAGGDNVLKALVALMKTVLRQQDSATRLDGEKFCVLLPGATASNAARVAERIRAEFNATPIVFGGTTTTLSLSAGVADSSNAPTSSLDSVLESANLALHQAKAAGRNRVALYGAGSVA